jgi:3-oxoadipate enol-lactonase
MLLAHIEKPSEGAAAMKRVTTEDAQLRCEHSLRPGAPALLLLNPLGTSLEIWDDAFPALSERYEVVRYDVRGHGESTTGSKTELTMEQLARDALAVLDSCGIARAHLCGLSIGGMTAMQIATLWPDRVLKIALCSTTPYMSSQTNWNERIAAVRAQGVAPLIDGILQRWLTTPYRMAHPETVERIRAMLLTVKPQGYAACAAAIRDMDQRQSIKTITAKTLVIGGTQDPGTTPADHALIAASIPGAQLVMLEAAHLLHIERRAEFIEALLQFLAA